MTIHKTKKTMKVAMCRYALKAWIFTMLFAIIGSWPSAAVAEEDVPHIIQPDNGAGGGIARIIRRTYPGGVAVTNQLGVVQYIMKGNAGGNGLCISPDGQRLVVSGNATWDGFYAVQIWQKSTDTFGWTVDVNNWYKELNNPGGYILSNPWIRANFTFGACTPDSQDVWLVDQTTKSLVKLNMSSDYTYDWDDPDRGTTQAKGLPDIVVTDAVNLVEPRQIVFGKGNGHAYKDMYIANGSAHNVVVYDGINGTYIKTIDLTPVGNIDWCGAVLADDNYLYIHLGRKGQNTSSYLFKYDFNTETFVTPLINGDNADFGGVSYMQWAPDGKIIYSAITPGWSYAVNEFDPSTGQASSYFAPQGSASECQTFTFYVPFSPPSSPKGSVIVVR